MRILYYLYKNKTFKILLNITRQQEFLFLLEEKQLQKKKKIKLNRRRWMPGKNFFTEKIKYPSRKYKTSPSPSFHYL